jgi:hypothetical protein
MSDHYQWAADLEADLQSAQATVNRLRDWMISQEIIVPEETDCVLGSERGHAPGKNYARAVNWESPMLLKTVPNGVEFVAKHSVFYSCGVAETTLTCPKCGQKSGHSDAWSDAVAGWYEKNGLGLLACQRCGIATPITDWPHEPPWAFGNVAVEFWNWPQLSDVFLKSVSELTGHRFRLVDGKL